MKRASKVLVKRTVKKSKAVLDQHAVPLIALVVGILVLASLSLINTMPTAGKATATLVRSYDIDTSEPVDLVSNKTQQVDVERITKWDVELQTTGGVDVYRFSVGKNTDGTFVYNLSTQDGEDTPFAVGRLGPQLTDTRGILVDDDLIPDLELHYANGILELVNLAVFMGAPADITLSRNSVELPSVFMALSGENISYLIDTNPQDNLDVISLKVWANSQQPTLVLVPNTNNQQYQFSFPAAVGQNELKMSVNLSADQGRMQINKSYIVGGDDIVYQLSRDANYPNMTVFLKDEATQKVEVKYQFPKGTDKLPFALPCLGRVSLSGFSLPPQITPQTTIPGTSVLNSGSLSVLHGFNEANQHAQGFAVHVPSEFYDIEGLNGYSLNVQGNNDLIFTVTCTLPVEPDQPTAERVDLPSLVPGWNLVSVAGITSVTKAELQKLKVPARMNITSLTEMIRNDNVTAEKNSLEPGKAYWVEVR